MSHSHTWKTWNGKGHQEIWLLSCFKKRRLKASIKYMFLVLLASCCRGNPSSGAKAYGTGPGKHLWYDVFHVAELGWLSWCKKQPVEKEEPNIQPPRLVTGTIQTDTNQQKRRVLNKYTSMITVRYKWPIIQPVFQRQRNCLIIALIPGGTFPRNKLYNAPTNLPLQPTLGSAGELSTWLGASFFEPRSNEMDWMFNVQMFLLDNVVGHCFKIESTPSPTTNTKSVCTMKPIKPLLFQGPFPKKTHQSYTSHCLAVSAKWVQGMPSLWQTGQFIHPLPWARWHRIIITFHW